MQFLWPCLARLCKALACPARLAFGACLCYNAGKAGNVASNKLWCIMNIKRLSFLFIVGSTFSCSSYSLEYNDASSNFDASNNGYIYQDIFSTDQSAKDISKRDIATDIQKDEQQHYDLEQEDIGEIDFILSKDEQNNETDSIVGTDANLIEIDQDIEKAEVGSDIVQELEVTVEKPDFPDFLSDFIFVPASDQQQFTCLKGSYYEQDQIVKFPTKPAPSQGFWIQSFPYRNIDYKKCLDDKKCDNKNFKLESGKELNVLNLEPNEASQFCEYIDPSFSILTRQQHSSGMTYKTKPFFWIQCESIYISGEKYGQQFIQYGKIGALPSFVSCPINGAFYPEYLAFCEFGVDGTYIWNTPHVTEDKAGAVYCVSNTNPYL